MSRNIGPKILDRLSIDICLLVLPVMLDAIECVVLEIVVNEMIEFTHSINL